MLSLPTDSKETIWTPASALRGADRPNRVIYPAKRSHRLLSYEQLAIRPFKELGVGLTAIKNALERRGYQRYVARSKPPLSEKNKHDRFRFAQEHLNWTREQWNQILWTDEAWVTGGRHRKQYVTRQKGEELDPTYVLDRFQR